MEGDDDCRPQQTVDELKGLVRDALVREGVLGKLRAQLRGAVLRCLNRSDLKDGPLYLTTERTRACKQGPVSTLLTRLLREYLLFHELDHSCGVYSQEASLDDRPSSRDDIISRLPVAASERVREQERVRQMANVSLLQLILDDWLAMVGAEVDDEDRTGSPARRAPSGRRGYSSAQSPKASPQRRPASPASPTIDAAAQPLEPVSPVGRAADPPDPDALPPSQRGVPPTAAAPAPAAPAPAAPAPAAAAAEPAAGAAAEPPAAGAAAPAAAAAAAVPEMRSESNESYSEGDFESPRSDARAASPIAASDTIRSASDAVRSPAAGSDTVRSPAVGSDVPEDSTWNSGRAPCDSDPGLRVQDQPGALQPSECEPEPATESDAAAAQPAQVPPPRADPDKPPDPPALPPAVAKELDEEEEEDGPLVGGSSSDDGEYSQYGSSDSDVDIHRPPGGMIDSEDSDGF